MNVNRLIVRCAESTVFFGDNYEWIPKFVKRNARFRIEPQAWRMAHGTGTRLWSTQEVIETLSYGPRPDHQQ